MNYLIKEINNLIKFEQMEIKAAYEKYYAYDKVILVEDLIDILEDFEKESKMKESQFSKQVVKYLKEKGALVNVNTANMFDKVGRSDVECCYKGYWISLELKVGSYQPDPLQISYLQKVREAGGFGLILRDNIHELMVLLHCIDNCVERQYKQPDLPEIKVEEIEYD